MVSAFKWYITMDNKLGKWRKCGFKEIKFFSGPVLTRGKGEEGGRN
jgi:hypothetical protein